MLAVHACDMYVTSTATYLLCTFSVYVPLLLPAQLDTSQVYSPTSLNAAE